jgi:hypothetical protein
MDQIRVKFIPWNKALLPLKRSTSFNLRPGEKVGDKGPLDWPPLLEGWNLNTHI